MLIGVLGFISMVTFDLTSMKNHVVMKYFFGLLGLVLVTYSTFKIIELGPDISVNIYTKYLGLVLAIVFFVLLIYSVFIEVGGNTYQKIAVPQLVTTGTYSLVRHPGVIWLFLAYFFSAVFFQNSVLVLTSIIWTGVNTLYIVLQEELVLKKIFVNYEEYRRTTPMVIPNVTSFRKFITIENWRK